MEAVMHNLNGWDLPENPLAPLTKQQKDLLSKLEEELHIGSLSDWEIVQETKLKASTRIEYHRQLHDLYGSIEQKQCTNRDAKYALYLSELQMRRAECQELCLLLEEVLEDFLALYKLYTEVSEKTISLHAASEQMIADQLRLHTSVDNIDKYVRYFRETDVMAERLDAPSLTVGGDFFFALLDRVDFNIDFMQANSTYKESGTYLARYKHCRSRAIAMIQNYVFDLFSKTTESILKLKDADEDGDNMDAALALFYGRFQTVLAKAKPVIEQVEAKSYKRQEYDSLLSECHQYYWSLRGQVLGSSINKSLISVREKYNGDHCSLVRHSCALLLHASIDEHKLFYEFFSKPSGGLISYLENLCTALYDALRPFVIHINHLETLAEICCILRIEMLDEHVQNNFEPLQGFGNVCLQLLHDVQERLVFRTHLYLRSDILNYKPSPGDLAYPEKLKMMEDIAESIREETRRDKMKRISVSTIDTSMEPVSRNHIAVDSIYQKTRLGNSPADMHGMWYPTVRRTLVCLSRLYRCLDRSVFQSLSQEAISLCVQSIESAKHEIESRTSLLDAELFQIKHLLILREQIAPFQVDFTIKEYSLDFSKVKTAAFGLLEKSSRLFALSNNALLEFLLEGAPQMREQLVDSRKNVDAKLKFSCQRLIRHATWLLVRPVLNLLEMEEWAPGQKLGDVQQVASAISETLRTIKFKCPEIQRAMQLYLSNKETEFILFRPVKNNACAVFTQLHQILGKHYEQMELQLIACPLPEQISVMLSSSSLTQGKGQSGVVEP
ncbi:hypothetical protein KM043_014364 [Ampulex compressa]|nr:hypothetical protein KM043_014364 [Ampulex compressa]